MIHNPVVLVISTVVILSVQCVLFVEVYCELLYRVWFRVQFTWFVISSCFRFYGYKDWVNMKNHIQLTSRAVPILRKISKTIYGMILATPCTIFWWPHPWPSKIVGITCSSLTARLKGFSMFFLVDYKMLPTTCVTALSKIAFVQNSLHKNASRVGRNCLQNKVK